MTNPTLDLEHVKAIEVADVIKAGRRAATLRRTADGVVFSYLDSYLAEHGPSVATTLPLSAPEVRTAAGAVPPFFAGLLPEGRRLSGLRRAVKTSADDELSLLLAVGGDPVGDVQIVASGTAPALVPALVEVSKEWSEVRFADLLGEAGVIDPVASLLMKAPPRPMSESAALAALRDMIESVGEIRG